ncbi:hypothetical protein amrb99_62000 [Actinomadura sp. RB99]|uniref:DUF2637 domain-containing protein n=1 Tax=Actinomadura sp. RB99 TaxID=2691577 RepID=UPI0016888868|nr:hypothetical protein [Actinomadura sp. RB99]
MSAADKAIRWGAAVAVTVVAGIAAVISYGHAYELAVRYGESGATARALPFTVDGLIVTCSLVLLDCARRGQRAPLLAWLLLGAGIAATVGANVAHGLSHGPVGAIIAGWPALVAVGSFEMLARLIRNAQPGANVAPEDVPAGAAGGLLWWPLPEFGAAGQGAPAPTLQGGQGPGGEHARERPPNGNGDGPGEDDAADVEPVLAGLVATARDRFATTLAAGSVPSVRALRRELRIGHPRAVAVRQALDGAAVDAGTRSGTGTAVG